MDRKHYAIAVGLMVLVGGGVFAGQESRKDFSSETQAERDARMGWWREARFGMFIHWGIYSVPAGVYDGVPQQSVSEWIMNTAAIPAAEYELYAQQFKPVQFNADEWVTIAKEAGMKYIVITSKHHDGFSMWDSAVTDYDVVDATHFKRDVLAELKKACDKQGIRLCFYHSIMDWRHPDAQGLFYPNYNDSGRSSPNFARYRDTYLRPQVRELVEKYDPAVMWFDGEWIHDWTEEDGKNLYNELRAMKPSLIINNRIGKGRAGMQGMNKGPDYVGDFGTPEQEIPPTGLPGVDWESCMTMNRSWGYKVCDNAWKSSLQLIRNLIDIASKGGNFLLNVGPTAQGRIPRPSVERLREMGAWLKVNGDAIYGTSASPYEPVDWGRFTSKPAEGLVYVHVFDWPKDGKLAMPQLKQKPVKAYLLADKDKSVLTIQTSEESGTTISLAEKAPDPISSVIVLQLEKPL